MTCIAKVHVCVITRFQRVEGSRTHNARPYLNTFSLVFNSESHSLVTVPVTSLPVLSCGAAASLALAFSRALI